MDYIYGKLNNKVKAVEYNGIDSDTANITIDNSDKENRTIKVDVIKTPGTLTINNTNGESVSFNGSIDENITIDSPTTEQYQELVTKVNDLENKKVSKLTLEQKAGSIVYGRNNTGTEEGVNYRSTAQYGSDLVYRNADGRAEIKDPINPLDIVNKQYADDIIPVYDFTTLDFTDVSEELRDNGRVSIEIEDETLKDYIKDIASHIRNNKVALLKIPGIGPNGYDASPLVLMQSIQLLGMGVYGLFGIICTETYRDSNTYDVLKVRIDTNFDTNTVHTFDITNADVEMKKYVDKADENLAKVMPTDINVDSNHNLILEHDGVEITGQKKQVVVPPVTYSVSPVAYDTIFSFDSNSTYILGNNLLVGDLDIDTTMQVQKGIYLQSSVTNPVLYIYNGSNIYTTYRTGSSGEAYITTYNPIMKEQKYTFAPNKSGIVAVMTDLDTKVSKSGDTINGNLTINGTLKPTTIASGEITTDSGITILDESSITFKDTTTESTNINTIWKDNGSNILQISGPLQVNDKLTTDGIDSLEDSTFNKNVIIKGNLSVRGTTTTVDTETLKVKDNVIVTNSDKNTLIDLSGLAINTDETNTFGIMYNPTSNTVDLGLGTITTEGKFTFNENEGLPLAIRDSNSSFTQDHLISWSDDKNKLTDSGIDKSKVAQTDKANVFTNGGNTFKGFIYLENQANTSSLAMIYQDYDNGTHLRLASSSGYIDLDTSESANVLTDKNASKYLTNYAKLDSKNTFTQAQTFSDSITVGKNDTYDKIINFGSTDKQIVVSGNSPIITFKTLGTTTPIYLTPYYDSEAEIRLGGNIVLDSALKTIEGQSIYGIGNVDLGLSNYAKLDSNNTFNKDQIFNSNISTKTISVKDSSSIEFYPSDYDDTVPTRYMQLSGDIDDSTFYFYNVDSGTGMTLDIYTEGKIITTANIAANVANKLDKVTTVDTTKLYMKNADGSQGMITLSQSASSDSVVHRDAYGKAQVTTPTDSDSVKTITNVEYVQNYVTNNSSKLTVTDNEDGTLTLNF